MAIPAVPDGRDREFRVRMRDALYARLCTMALEARMEPSALASAILERTARRYRPKPPEPTEATAA